MNVVVLSGRLTRDPEYKISQNGAETKELVKFTLAVDRRGKTADFISCVGFGHNASFVNKYFSKGSKIEVKGSIQTGSYQDRDGKTVYTTDVIIDEVNFGESKSEAESRGISTSNAAGYTSSDAPIGSADFMNVGKDVEAELPFLND